MSQMSGNLDFNLADGVFWGAVIELSPNGLPRKKIVAQIGSNETKSPTISLIMDEQDYLYLEVIDWDGKVFQTEKISPMVFGFKRDFLFFEVYVDKSDENPKHDLIKIRLKFGDDTERLGSGTGRFAGAVENGKSAFGAALDTSKPARFKLFELVIVGRAPLEQKEFKKLRGYMKSKHKLDVDHV